MQKKKMIMNNIVILVAIIGTVTALALYFTIKKPEKVEPPPYYSQEEYERINKEYEEMILIEWNANHSFVGNTGLTISSKSTEPYKKEGYGGQNNEYYCYIGFYIKGELNVRNMFGAKVNYTYRVNYEWSEEEQKFWYMGTKIEKS